MKGSEWGTVTGNMLERMKDKTSVSNMHIRACRKHGGH